ncbi:MAG: hypothetical protein KBD63_04365 [Bacteriovoracaceae bacterium]|nr:hypothetical protein [Bacteriovoracaceae bacterium]
MKSQKYNQGELKELKVMIDKNVVDAFEIMSKNSKKAIDELVVIALLRYKSAHTDYLGDAPQVDQMDRFSRGES